MTGEEQGQGFMERGKYHDSLGIYLLIPVYCRKVPIWLVWVRCLNCQNFSGTSSLTKLIENSSKEE